MEINREKVSIAARQKEAVPFIQPSLFTKASLRFAILASASYLLLSYFLVGFRPDQIALVVIFNALYFGSFITRRFILAFSIFIVYWIFFDYQKAFPNYHYSDVHIQDLYNWEKSWFGIEWKNTIITPNEYFAQNNSSFIDVLTGIFYLCWIPVPFGFAAVMFFKNRNLFFQFSLTFVVVNIIGWTGYYSYPAAPPWYVAQHGFDFVASTAGSTAGFARFDDFLGVKIFEGIYAKSSNVFAAMPSLHAAYMLIVFYYSVKAKLKLWNVLFGIILLGIWFGAVYSSHHYILDVLAGITCTIIGIFIFQTWVRSKPGQRVLNRLIVTTSKEKI